MGYDWDPAKNASNRRKHGISFQQAVAVFDDPARVGWKCSDPGDDEERFKVIDRYGWKMVCVVYTMRGEVVRLISARKANQDERRTYGQS